MSTAIRIRKTIGLIERFRREYAAEVPEGQWRRLVEDMGGMAEKMEAPNLAYLLDACSLLETREEAERVMGVRLDTIVRVLGL